MSQLDDSIEVDVISEYLPEQSVEDEQRYVFAYHIRLINHGEQAATLRSRHWFIANGNGEVQEVNGEGVVEERQLTVLQDMGDDWVVSEGLQPGDQLIVAGLQKVQPGATVNVEERAPQESAEASGTNGETDIASAGE